MTNLENKIDVDYDRISGTDYYGRDSHLENVYIAEINVDKVCKELLHAYSICRNIDKCSYTKIDEYCFNRLCYVFKVWDKNKYEINLYMGYYGEEVGSVEFVNEEELFSAFDTIECIDRTKNAEKIKKVLEYEYGYMTSFVENCLFASIIKVSPSMIETPNDIYVMKLERDVVDSYKKYNGIVAVVRKTGDNQYRIIDGYHRLNAHRNDNAVDVILLED